MCECVAETVVDGVSRAAGWQGGLAQASYGVRSDVWVVAEYRAENVAQGVAENVAACAAKNWVVV